MLTDYCSWYIHPHTHEEETSSKLESFQIFEVIKMFGYYILVLIELK